jgi:hypothetical protein
MQAKGIKTALNGKKSRGKIPEATSDGCYSEAEGDGRSGNTFSRF